MAKTKTGWLPVGTGLVTTLLAVWVAVTLNQPEEAVVQATEPTELVTGQPEAESATLGAVTSVVTLPPVVITTPPPEMQGLSESVARVLATQGFASEFTESDIANQLPGSVYRTLVANEVVLSIATEDPGQ